MVSNYTVANIDERHPAEATSSRWVRCHRLRAGAAGCLLAVALVAAGCGRPADGDGIAAPTTTTRSVNETATSQPASTDEAVATEWAGGEILPDTPLGIPTAGARAASKQRVVIVDTPDEESETTPTVQGTEQEPVGRRYEVEPGDTLSGIAGRFGVTVEEIARINGIDDVHEIKPGEELIIPG